MTEYVPVADPPKIVGHVRVITARGGVFDIPIRQPFNDWWRGVHYDDTIVTLSAIIPWHAIDSVHFSEQPFPPLQPTVGQMPIAGNA